MTERWSMLEQTLLTVDDMVRHLVEVVDEHHATPNTYFFFTSE